MLDLNDVIKKIKKIENIKSDKDFADIINIKPDALVQRKNRNSIPHDNIIKYCLKNKVSLDMIYENNNIKIDNTVQEDNNTIEITLNESKFPISRIQIIDKDDFLKLPMHNPSKMLKAHIDYSSSNIFIIDTIVNKYEDEGLYLIKYQERTYVKNIVDTFSGTFQINSYSTKNMPVTSFEISTDKISEIIILGTVSKIISLK